MHFHLDELQQGKEVTRELDLEREDIRISSGDAVVHNLKAQLKFRMDPLGYTVKYSVRASVSCECIRCAGTLQVEVDKTDWVALRIQHPKEAHVLLDNSEMNTRFITDLKFDFKDFILEAVELEIPPFPRHEDDSQECFHLEEAEPEEEPRSSPFDALSKFL